MQDPAKPHLYPRRVLIAVSGMSPQIVSETVYALAVQSKPRWVPTEIHLVTTVRGAELISDRLLDPARGALPALRREYRLPAIACGEAQLHVASDARGRPLADIVSPDDNEAMADCITATVREQCRDANAAVHVSLAGGRKTMSYYAGYALSLFGRAQDRLSHVLVAPAAFESLDDFHFPSRHSRQVRARDGSQLDCRDATVLLAEVPFVRLGDGSPKTLLGGAKGFSQTVRDAQLAIERPRARLHAKLGDTQLTLGGRPIALRPKLMALYLVFLQARLEGWDVDRARDREAVKASLFKANLRVAHSKDAVDKLKEDEADKTVKAQKSNRAAELEMSLGDFDSLVSRCNSEIRKALGSSAANAYCIVRRGKRAHSKYGIYGLDAGNIVIA